jgi:hypothetical protein
MQDVGQGLDMAGKAVQIGSVLGNELIGPGIVGLANSNVESQVQAADAGLAEIGRARAANALLQSGAERGAMASMQPPPERAGRRSYEEALAPPIVQPDPQFFGGVDPVGMSPMERLRAPIPGMDMLPQVPVPQIPQQLPRSMQPANPYRMRLDDGNTPERDARSRAADLMLGMGAVGSTQTSAQRPAQAAFAVPAVDQLDWGHTPPMDRRSVQPKAPYDPRLLPQGLPPQEVLLGMSSDEVLPPGLFNAPQAGMPQPGTPEFRAMLEQQQPQTEDLSAGKDNSWIGVVKRYLPGAGFVPRPQARPRKAAPSLQQKVDVAQGDIAQQVQRAQQQNAAAYVPAREEAGEAIGKGEGYVSELEKNYKESQPDQSERAISADLDSAQRRQPLQVEEYDYSVPQLEALITKAKATGDREAIQKVADAISRSSMRGARAQSVFADLLGGAHVGRERTRLMGALTGVTQAPESASDLATALSKAAYQRRVGERMEDKGLVDADRMNFRQADAARRLGTAEVGARSQAARAVGAQASAENVAAQTEVLVPKTKAGMAKDYGIAANASASARRTNKLTPVDYLLKLKKLNEQPKEGKGFSLMIGGKGATKEQAQLVRKVRDEADRLYTDAAKAVSSLAGIPERGSMERDRHAQLVAQWAKSNEAAVNRAAALLAQATMKKEQIGDAALPTGEKLADYLGLDEGVVKRIKDLEGLPQFNAAYKQALAAKQAEAGTPADPTAPTNNSRYTKPGED